MRIDMHAYEATPLPTANLTVSSPATQVGAGGSLPLCQAGVPAWPGFLLGQVERPIRVLLIDDDPHVRNVIAQELLGDLRINLVAQGSSVREARKLMATHDFDVLVVDLNLGDGSGFELIDQAKQRRTGVEVIVVSALEDDDKVLQAFELGATGYLAKNSWFGNFAQSVLQVVNGGASITPNLARRLLGKLNRSGARRESYAPPSQDLLSAREAEVLGLVACGHTSAEIATRLAISGQTVDTHVKNIYRKLRVRSRAQAVSCASARGLI